MAGVFLRAGSTACTVSTHRTCVLIDTLQAGARYFGTTKATETYKELDISADNDDSVQIPDMEGRPVPASASDVLPWTPEWTKWPDYERVCIAQTQLYWDTRQFTSC